MQAPFLDFLFSLFVGFTQPYW